MIINPFAWVCPNREHILSPVRIVDFLCSSVILTNLKLKKFHFDTLLRIFVMKGNKCRSLEIVHVKIFSLHFANAKSGKLKLALNLDLQCFVIRDGYSRPFLE